MTASPNWGSKNASNTNWEALDPHSDGDQRSSSDNGLSRWVGCFMHRNQTKRRFPSRQIQRGVVNSLRLNPSSTQIRGSELVEYNILTDELEAAFNNSEAILVAPAGAMRPGATTTIRNNWYETLLYAGSGAHLSVSGNSAGWSGGLRPRFQPSLPAIQAGR